MTLSDNEIKFHRFLQVVEFFLKPHYKHMEGFADHFLEHNMHGNRLLLDTIEQIYKARKRSPPSLLDICKSHIQENFSLEELKKIKEIIPENVKLN
jgi:hypothetical protein